ncbi:MAG TPA: alginate lyase family protein [Opitutaceae bacterium]|jgi:hypothetical protein|nr:alginate lyase family protein [Opitutaceae bacterium]
MKTLLLTFMLIATAAGATTPLQVYSLHADTLAAARTRLAQGDSALAPALEHLRGEADRALKFQPVSVMDKSRTPPSGDKHDYLSQAPYWWPDPSKPDGLPYIRHDGKHNPEVDHGTDAPVWGRMSSAVETLGLAFYFTHKEAYAEHAALLIRTWFLNPATRMNPNLNFGQYVPGRNEGRGEGVLALRSLAEICDTLSLITGSPAWSTADDQAFREWLAAYLKWLTTSSVGLEEAHATNNHGSWYDMQAADIALVLGQTDFARKILTDGLEKRLAIQVMPDGSQPQELARTKSLGYSLFNLQALCKLATLAEHVDIDWWGYATKDGRSLRAALRYLAPYADPDKPWIKSDLVAGGRTDLLPLFAEALRHGDDAQFRELLAKFGNTAGQQSARWRLLLDMPPH